MIQKAPAEFQHSFDCYVRPSAMLCSFSLSFYFHPEARREVLEGHIEIFTEGAQSCFHTEENESLCANIKCFSISDYAWFGFSHSGVKLFAQFSDDVISFPVIYLFIFLSPTQWSWLSSNLQELRCFCDLNKMTDKVGGRGKSLAFNNRALTICVIWLKHKAGMPVTGVCLYPCMRQCCHSLNVPPPALEGKRKCGSWPPTYTSHCNT